MSPKDKLLELYATWRHWSDLETSALHASNWPEVSKCQAAKEALQPLITVLTETVHSDVRKSGPQAAAAQREIRSIIQELVQMETSNRDTLSARSVANRRQLAQLNTDRQNLARVQSCYGHRFPAGWHSYS